MILDTNALSAFADGDRNLLRSIQSVRTLFVPVIVLGEYRYGIAQSRHRRDYEEWLEEFLRDVGTLPIIESTTIYYSKIAEKLKANGTPIPSNDVWIAAIALEHDLPIISQDKHFDNVQSVQRRGW